MSFAMMAACGSRAAPPRPVPPSAAVATSPPPQPTMAAPAFERDDFEAASPGSLPAGWRIIGQPKGLSAAATRVEDRTALEVTTSGTGAALRRSIDVARFRGQRVRVSARIRCVAPCGLGLATIGVDIARPGADRRIDRIRSHEIDEETWQDYQAFGDVPSDATGLEMVVTAQRAITFQVDDIAIRAIGAAGAGDEPPRPLDGRGLDNVVAFARLYGIVRYFHPSDEAAALDETAWERFVARGVREVEPAPDAAALVARLSELFAPIAPAVVLYRDGAGAPAAVPGEAATLHWIHHGVGISPGSTYTSTRGTSTVSGTVGLSTSIDAAKLRGKRIKLVLRGRGQVATGAQVELWAAELKGGGKRGLYVHSDGQPPIRPAWTEISIELPLSAETETVRLGLSVSGDADVWLEPPTIAADGATASVPDWAAPGAKLAASWDSSGTGFVSEIDARPCEPHRSCLHAHPVRGEPPDLRPWTHTLGGGVTTYVPIALATQDGKTIPHAAALLPRGDDAVVATDRATRLTAVIIGWNVFEHFYPYFDVAGNDWMAELPARLREAAIDEGPAALLATLRHMVHDLRDGHGSVSHATENWPWQVPWLWEQVEGKLAITQVDDDCHCDLAPGDIVTAIDGVPTAQAVATAAAAVSTATEQFRWERALRRLHSGPEGGRRTVTVVRAGQAHDVDVALVEASLAPVEDRPPSGAEVAPGIRYVNLDTATAEDWSKILPDLATAKAVVCDMRGYPGFTLTEPLAHFTRKKVRSARWNIPNPARPDREGMTFVVSDWSVAPRAPFIDHVVFLTDGRAVSAAETFMGIVEAHKLGPIVGGATAGTNGNINPFYVPGNFLIWWTGLKVLKPDGSRHHGVGILPTVPVTRTLAGVAARRDEVLEAGIEAARRLVAKPARMR